MIDWLKLEVKLTEEHLADLEAGGSVMGSNGADVTHDWITAFKRRIEGFKEQIAHLETDSR